MIKIPYTRFKVHDSEHLKHDFRVHALLADFQLEDVWRVPVEVPANYGLRSVMDQFIKADNFIQRKGLAGALFSFRMFIGKVLNLGDEPAAPVALVPGTIRARYASEEGLGFSDLPDPGLSSFIPVYKLENEHLSEIENRTVHAAVHFGKVSLDSDVWTVHMAVYVKPKGPLGKFYMLLIKPFRLWIVYPTMMKAFKGAWDMYMSTLTNRA